MGLVALGGRVGTTCSFFRVLVGQVGGLRAYHRKASPHAGPSQTSKLSSLRLFLQTAGLHPDDTLHVAVVNF